MTELLGKHLKIAHRQVDATLGQKLVGWLQWQVVAVGITVGVAAAGLFVAFGYWL